MADSRDVFISYARPSEDEAHRIAELLRGKGFSVWRDDELPAHRAYSDVIEERLKSAKAVVVLWSGESAKSHWVRAEADTAREAGTLVQATLDSSLPPMPFNQIQCADLNGWNGDTASAGWRKLEGSVAALVGGGAEPDSTSTTAAPRKQAVRASVCVLPFVNMSGEPEQEYFSDGITEDITTDLSKISALEVVARNTAFAFKGQNPDVQEVARQLSVTHVLEGSVRKAGSRVRINAQLIDGSTGKHLWADRYDRDLTDIFEIQDEISKAIVEALKVNLLPREKKAIEARGTESVEAYNTYLIARQQLVGAFGDAQIAQTVVRLCRQATLLDPNYAEAWALMALAQLRLRLWHGKDDDPLPAAERAVEINPNLAIPYCIKANYLDGEGRNEEAEEQIRKALELDPESWEVNHEASRLFFRHGQAGDSVPFFKKAASLIESDWRSPMMLMTCYLSLGDDAGVVAAAKMTLERTEKIVARDPTNVSALAAGSGALIRLGDEQRAREWIARALLLDPDNLNMRYNIACTFVVDFHDNEQAIDTLAPFFERINSTVWMRHVDADPDLDALRRDSRFQAMLASAKQRLGMAEAAE
jgi:adenylate cyclase